MILGAKIRNFIEPTKFYEDLFKSSESFAFNSASSLPSNLLIAFWICNLDSYKAFWDLSLRI